MTVMKPRYVSGSLFVVTIKELFVGGVSFLGGSILLFVGKTPSGSSVLIGQDRLTTTWSKEFIEYAV